MALNVTSPGLEKDPAGDLAFIEDKMATAEEGDTIVSGLSKHISSVWAKVQEENKPIRKEMVEILRRVKGEYSAEKASQIKAFKGSDIYLRAGESKCRAAESWIKDIYRGDKDLPWDLEPTAIPEMPEEDLARIQEETAQQADSIEKQLLMAGQLAEPKAIADLMQKYYEAEIDKAKKELSKSAKAKCARAATLIRDQNQEGGWDGAFKDFLYHFTRMPYSVIKGPVLVRKPKEVWQPDPLTQKISLMTEDTLVTDVYSPSPFDIFTSKGMRNSDDGDMIEIHELSVSGLTKMIGVPGYDEDEIRKVIRRYEKGSLKPKWFTIDDETVVNQVKLSRKSENKAASVLNDGKEDMIRAQEFYGSVSGRLLLDWGIDKGKPPEEESTVDPEMQYQVNCWKIGQYVIKAVINPDNLGRKPYHFTSWAKNPASVIGEGLMQFAGPIEDAMNAIARALINNIAIASGPMAEIDRDRVDTKTPIYPWRQIESTSKRMNTDGPAVNYYQPQMHAQELITAWQFFSKVLDEMTVPAYAQGASQSGVTAGTATVFTQLLAAASRSIKAVVANIDDDIITPYIEMCYSHNMKFNESPEDHGDSKVVAKGVSGLLAKEQQAQRKVEFLQIAANPTYQQILGEENIGSVLAQVAKSNDIDLPDKDRLNGDIDFGATIENMLMAQAGIDPMQANGQVAAGGGAPAGPQGTNPDGSKAGVNNG